jgi:hypothetical protein
MGTHDHLKWLAHQVIHRNAAHSQVDRTALRERFLNELLEDDDTCESQVPCMLSVSRG